MSAEPPDDYLAAAAAVVEAARNADALKRRYEELDSQLLDLIQERKKADKALSDAVDRLSEIDKRWKEGLGVE